MHFQELLFVVVIGGLVLALPLVTFVLAIVAYRRSGRIAEMTAKIARLETQVRSIIDAGGAVPPQRSMTTDLEPRLTREALAGDVLAASTSVPSDDQATGSEPSLPMTVDTNRQGRDNFLAGSASGPVGWETFVGQKAFGWLAVILFVFSAVFFLRYAFQNNFIGPVGRVAIGELIGVTLIVAGWQYFQQGLARFSGMLTAAGIVIVYLTTYCAFGLYGLLPQTHAGLFLALLVFESMLIAVLYGSTSVALAAVIGGLMVPVLLASDRDTYWSFFTYLAILNASIVVANIYRRWPAVLSTAYLGTQLLFWLWYSNQYHPDKFAWAIGFQWLIFAMYIAHVLITTKRGADTADIEELVRLVGVALLGFASIQTLLRDDYRVWLGTVAISMAATYAILARATLTLRSKDNRLLLTLLALSFGFIAWALPIQANASNVFAPVAVKWVAVGWAAMGAALWWFGLRISAPPLRVMAGVFGVAASLRLLMQELPFYIRDPFIPVLNWVAIPSLSVAIFILVAVVLTNSFLSRLKSAERIAVTFASIVGVCLLLLVLSTECYGYFVSQSLYGGDISVWRWRGQLALTVLWTLFASTLLVLGFRLDRARLRWFAMGLYGVTVLKLFVVDMANVQQLYRILAFFVLAVVLGLVARTYQRFK